MGRHICLVGLQWGDEGKGKIVDSLSSQIDAVVRFQGGGNAGHTIWVDSDKFVVHHIPTGVLHDGVLAILGNGMVIDPEGFLEEWSTLDNEQKSRVFISDRAHVTLPEHKRLDISRETGGTSEVIGTTRRGIGPTYEAKFARFGVRVGELLNSEIWETRFAALPTADRTLLKKFVNAITVPTCRVTDTTSMLWELDDQGKTFLFEGAQGVLLDIDFGQYPFVTSSSCTFLGLGTGTGFSPRKIGRVIGVVKAYPTRIGTGPFPSEGSEAEDEWLREAGHEYGATTGRPRRCGWLDIPALRYAVKVSDVDEIALTKTDILNGYGDIPVCVGYEFNGQVLDFFPSDTKMLDEVRPIYEKWPGWTGTNDIDAFLSRLETALACPVTMVGHGVDRKDLLVRDCCGV